MQQFLTVIMMAVIVEGLITYAKTFFAGGKFQWQQLLGIGLGVLVTLAYNIDVFSLLGINTVVPFIGAILTGILISRGSNYIFDLLRTLQGVGSSSAPANDSPLPLAAGQAASTDPAQQYTVKSVVNNTAPNPPDTVKQ